MHQRYSNSSFLNVDSCIQASIDYQPSLKTHVDSIVAVFCERDFHSPFTFSLGSALLLSFHSLLARDHALKNYAKKGLEEQIHPVIKDTRFLVESL
jgi:hypothetical protein